MQGLLVLIVGKVVEIVLKYLIAWGETSIARQKAIKEKMEAYKASQEAAKIKAQNYENNPTANNRDDVP